jgi:hypothetical protein
MLHGRLRRRFLIATLAAGCCFAAPQAAARADEPQVTVVAPGGVRQTLALAAMAGADDVLARPYAVRSATGESTRTVTGFSLAALIDAAGVDPFGFSYLEVQGPGGGAVLLSRDQALDPGAFPDGPPVVYRAAGGTAFLRPSVSSEDKNAADCFEAPQGVSLVLRKGSPLRVKVSVSAHRTRPGEAVAFTASVERSGSGEELAYSWYFDDGHSAAGPGVKHSFAKRGSYDVVVGVTAPGNDAGTSTVVNIQVGPPLAGPDRKGGGERHAANGPDHGAAAGARGPVFSTPQPSTSESPSTRHGPGPARRNDRSDRKAHPTPDSGGKPISGRLLGGSTAIRPSPQAPAARAGHQVKSDGDNLPASGIGALIAIGLLGAGALFELRGGGFSAAIGGWR